MKKNIILISFIVFLLAVFTSEANRAFADWWERSSVRPTQPSIERTPFPTSPQQPTQVPTSVPTQEPTVTSPPSGGIPTSAPTSIPEEEVGEDACAPGKPYTGPYCGWSPRIGGEEENEEVDYFAQLEEPEVLGLSDTSGENLNMSDIMLLAGVLCLLLYARSKIAMGKNV